MIDCGLQAVFPIGTREKPCLRTGYRSVPLKNIYNETQELSSLLACPKL